MWNTKTEPMKKKDHMKLNDTNRRWNGADGRSFKEVVLQRDGNRANHNAKEQKNLKGNMRETKEENTIVVQCKGTAEMK